MGFEPAPLCFPPSVPFEMEASAHLRIARCLCLVSFTMRARAQFLQRRMAVFALGCVTNMLLVCASKSRQVLQFHRRIWMVVGLKVL